MPDSQGPADSLEKKRVSITTYVYLIIAFWTLAVGASLMFNIRRTYEYAADQARTQARVAFEKDIMYRRWNSMFGGVYVRVTESIQPNPYLKQDPNRDIPGPNGTLLTKVNPAYMTRMVHELGESESDVRGHITSTNPIRPENRADEWEKASLLRLEKEKLLEITEQQTMGGKEYMRLISPLKTDASCLVCHGHQGYQLGDQRGGISVSVPMAPIIAKADSAAMGLAFSHVGMWLIGVIVSVIGGKRLQRQVRERDKVAERLRRLTEDLEQRVADRTRDLHASMEAAKEASKAKSDFLANISHEVRTPLNGVLGMADLLLRTELDEQQSSMAATIKTAGDSLLCVLNDVLDFSKIEAGKMLLDPQPFSLRDIVFDVMKNLAPIAYKKKLEMIVNIAPQIPDAVVGDSLRIRQVLMNLVGNAIKFTNQGEVVLTVGVLNLADGKVKLRFSVSDTGIGIALDKQQRIFTAFEQADSSTTRKYGGTGLGLAISCRLVSLMGGMLELESSEGQGSTFSFTLDLPFLNEARSWNSTIPAQLLENLHVLIVDDNATNRKILLEQLNDWGMKPVESVCADEALRLLRVASNSFSPFAVVLSDLQMPEKDGVDLIRAMKNEKAIADTPVILLSSGELPPGTLSSLYSANLTKPVRPEELLRAMATATGVLESFDLGHLQEQAKQDAARVSETRLRVLLVEDMEMNQLVATRMLKNLGHDPTVAGDGKQALEILAQREFDIVFMDIQMPVMDGMQAIAAIREQEERNGEGHLPVVAMTANALKGDRERYLQAGMDSYIAKPVTLADLARVIDELVERHGLSSHENPAAENAENDATKTTLPEGLDPDILERSFSGDDELARQSMEIYLRDAPALLEEIKKAITREDNSALTTNAHALKGLTGYYTNGGLYETSLALERMGREKALPGSAMDVMRAAEALQAGADGLMRAMRAFLAR